MQPEDKFKKSGPAATVKNANDWDEKLKKIKDEAGIEAAIAQIDEIMKDKSLEEKIASLKKIGGIEALKKYKAQKANILAPNASMQKQKDKEIEAIISAYRNTVLDTLKIKGIQQKAAIDMLMDKTMDGGIDVLIEKIDRVASEDAQKKTTQIDDAIQILKERGGIDALEKYKNKREDMKFNEVAAREKNDADVKKIKSAIGDEKAEELIKSGGLKNKEMDQVIKELMAINGLRALEIYHKEQQRIAGLLSTTLREENKPKIEYDELEKEEKKNRKTIDELKETIETELKKVTAVDTTFLKKLEKTIPDATVSAVAKKPPADSEDPPGAPPDAPSGPPGTPPEPPGAPDGPPGPPSVPNVPTYSPPKIVISKKPASSPPPSAKAATDAANSMAEDAAAGFDPTALQGMVGKLSAPKERKEKEEKTPEELLAATITSIKKADVDNQGKVKEIKEARQYTSGLVAEENKLIKAQKAEIEELKRQVRDIKTLQEANKDRQTVLGAYTDKVQEALTPVKTPEANVPDGPPSAPEAPDGPPSAPGEAPDGPPGPPSVGPPSPNIGRSEPKIIIPPKNGKPSVAETKPAAVDVTQVFAKNEEMRLKGLDAKRDAGIIKLLQERDSGSSSVYTSFAKKYPDKVKQMEGEIIKYIQGRIEKERPLGSLQIIERDFNSSTSLKKKLKRYGTTISSDAIKEIVPQFYNNLSTDAKSEIQQLYDAQERERITAEAEKERIAELGRAAREAEAEAQKKENEKIATEKAEKDKTDRYKALEGILEKPAETETKEDKLIAGVTLKLSTVAGETEKLKGSTEIADLEETAIATFKVALETINTATASLSAEITEEFGAIKKEINKKLKPAVKVVTEAQSEEEDASPEPEVIKPLVAPKVSTKTPMTTVPKIEQTIEAPKFTNESPAPTKEQVKAVPKAEVSKESASTQSLELPKTSTTESTKTVTQTSAPNRAQNDTNTGSNKADPLILSDTGKAATGKSVAPNATMTTAPGNKDKDNVIPEVWNRIKGDVTALATKNGHIVKPDGGNKITVVEPKIDIVNKGTEVTVSSRSKETSDAAIEILVANYKITAKHLDKKDCAINTSPNALATATLIIALDKTPPEPKIEPIMKPRVETALREAAAKQGADPQLAKALKIYDDLKSKRQDARKLKI